MAASLALFVVGFLFLAPGIKAGVIFLWAAAFLPLAMITYAFWPFAELALELIVVLPFAMWAGINGAAARRRGQ